AIYETFKSLILAYSPNRERGCELDFTERFCSATTSAMIAQALVYPLELAKTRMNTTTKGGLFHVLSDAVKLHGWLSLYQGLYPSLLRVGGDVAIYESLK